MAMQQSTEDPVGCPTTFTLNVTGHTCIPLRQDQAVYAGTVNVEQDGLLTVSLHATRPLRVWIGHHLVVDDAPQRDRSHIFRRLRLAVSVPLTAGTYPVVIQVASRPSHIRGVDDECPTDYRPAILAAVARYLPDQLDFQVALLPGGAGPAVCLRFEPGQFRSDGSVWQDVWVRRIAGFSPLFQPWTGWEAPPVSWTPRLSSSVAPGKTHPVSPWEGRPADEIRVYVPVTVNNEEPRTARAVGKDDRPEPERTVVGEILLTVSDPSGDVVFPMPVYESIGKLAPKQHYAEVPAPVLDRVWPTVPEPILPPQWEALGRMYRMAWEAFCTTWAPVTSLSAHTLYRGLWRALPIESGYPNGYVRTSEQGFPNSQFVWDSCFSALGYAYGWRAYPVTASVDCLYATQQDGGHIERAHDVRDGTVALFEPGFGVGPPLFPAVELALARLSGQTSRLAAVYPALDALYRWLAANRRMPSGIYWTTTLANGRDNAPSPGEGSLDLTAQMAQFTRDCALIASILGKQDDAAQWQEQHRNIVEALNAVLWSEEIGCYAYSLIDGRPNPHKVATTFWPLWADAVPAARIPALVRMARNPATFNRHHPFPSLAADSSCFKPTGHYWLGSVWAPTNYAALKGFWQAGEYDVSREFALRHLLRMAEVYDATGGVLWENYSSEQSTPGSSSAKNYCWTCGNAISVLLECVIGLAPDAINHRICWTPPPGVHVGVKRYPCGKATVDLLQIPSSEGDRYEVVTDQPITLEIMLNSTRNTYQLQPGSRVIHA